MAEHYYTPKLKNGFMGSGQKQFNRMSICDPDIFIWIHSYISRAYEIVEK